MGACSSQNASVGVGDRNMQQAAVQWQIPEVVTDWDTPRVCSWLENLENGKFKEVAEKFKAESINGSVLSNLTENEFQTLVPALGRRKKLVAHLSQIADPDQEGTEAAHFAITVKSPGTDHNRQMSDLGDLPQFSRNLSVQRRGSRASLTASSVASDFVPCEDGSVIIKTKFERDVRNIVIPLDNPWPVLISKLHEIYGPRLRDERLRFRDLDGDMVTLANNSDLLTAVESCMAQRKKLKVYVTAQELGSLLQSPRGPMHQARNSLCTLSSYGSSISMQSIDTDYDSTPDLPPSNGLTHSHTWHAHPPEQRLSAASPSPQLTRRPSKDLWSKQKSKEQITKRKSRVSDAWSQQHMKVKRTISRRRSAASASRSPSGSKHAAFGENAWRNFEKFRVWIDKIKGSWVQALDKLGFGPLLVQHLLEESPAAAAVYGGTNTLEEGRRVVSTISSIIADLEDLRNLETTVQDVAAELGWSGEEPYKEFSRCLMWTLDKHLGPAFTPDVRLAWKSVWNELVTPQLIKAGCEEHSANNPRTAG